MPTATAPNQAPNPLRQIRTVLTSVIESVAGDIDKILSLDKDQKGNIVGKFHIGDQVYNFTVTPDGKFTYDEAEKGGMRSDALLEGFYQGEWRNDATRRSGDRRGKKCGDGYISADYECSIGLSPLMKERVRSVFSALGRSEARQQAERQQQAAAPKKGSGNLAKAAGAALAGAAVAGAGVAAAGAIAKSGQKQESAPSIAEQAQQAAETVSEVAASPKGRTALKGAVVVGAYLGISEIDRKYQIKDTVISGAARTAFAGANLADLSKAIDKLPIGEGSAKKAKSLVGASKVALVRVMNEREGAELLGVDPKTNAFTYKLKDGSYQSVTSVGGKVLLFTSNFRGKLGDQNVYSMKFTVDNTFDRNAGSREEGLALAKNAKSIFNRQLDLVPDGSHLVCWAHRKDGAGEKRQNIYEKAGFTRVEDGEPDKSEQALWAYKQDGKIVSPEGDEAAKYFDEWDADFKQPIFWEAIRQKAIYEYELDEKAKKLKERAQSLRRRAQRYEEASQAVTESGQRSDSAELDDAVIAHLDSVLDLILADASDAFVEGYLQCRADKESRPGYTWVDDRRIKNGGYWRKLKGGTAVAGVTGALLVGGAAIAGTVALRGRQSGSAPVVEPPAQTKKKGLPLTAKTGMAAGVAALGVAGQLGGAALARSKKGIPSTPGSPPPDPVPRKKSPASIVIASDPTPPEVLSKPRPKLPSSTPSNAPPSPPAPPPEPMTVGEMMVRRYPGSRNLKEEDIQEAIDFISTAPGGDAAVFDLALEETPTRQKLKAAGTVLKIGVQNPKIGLRLYRVGVKAAQDITYNPDLASATARTLTSNPRAQKAIERAARDTFITSTAADDLVRRGGRNLVNQIERDTMALGAAAAIFWKEGTVRGLWSEAQQKARQRQEKLGRRTDSQDDGDAIFLLDLLDLLRGTGDRADSGPTRPGYTWVDDRRVENGGYWRKLPKRSTQIAKGVAGTAIAAAVVAGGAMALRSRQSAPTPVPAKPQQDWRIPALGGVAAGAASAGFAAKWGTEAAAKRQIERARNEAWQLAEAQIEAIRNEEGNRSSSEVSRLQKEADSRLGGELEKARAGLRAEYEPQLAATEQKRIALEQEIARREKDFEAERKQSGDRLTTELEKVRAELRAEYEPQLSAIREEKSALERAIAQRDANLEALSQQAKSTLEEQTRQSSARLQIEIDKARAEYERSLGEKESELQKIKASTNKEIAKLSEGLKRQQATERDRISEGIKAGVEPAVKELEQARTQLQSDYENRVAQIQLDFENRAREIESGIAKEVLRRSREAEERINADAQRQIEEGRQRSLKEAQAEIQAAEDKRLAGNTNKGSLISDEKEGIALSASIRRGMKLDEIPPDSLQRRFGDAVDGLTRKRLAREIGNLGNDFAERAKEIRKSSRRPAEKWRMLEESLLRQTNRENGIGGAVDDVRREFRDRHLEALRSFLSKVEGRGKFDNDLVSSFDKELTRLNKEMRERIDQAVKEVLEGQPLDLPPGVRKDSADPLHEARLLVREAIAHAHPIQGLPTVRLDDEGSLTGTFLTPDRTRLEYAIALNGTLYTDEPRTDSDSKPCGKGWISEGEECHVGKSRLPAPLRRATDKARQLIQQGNERENKMRAKLQEKGVNIPDRTEILKEGVVAGAGIAGSAAAGPVGSVVASAGARALVVAGSKVRTAKEAEERRLAIAEIAEETTKEMWGAIVGEAVSAGVTTAIGKSIPGVGMLPAMKTQGRLTEATKAGVRAIARRTIKVGKGSSSKEKAAPNEAAK